VVAGRGEEEIGVQKLQGSGVTGVKALWRKTEPGIEQER
jgi:hypothetical protein